MRSSFAYRFASPRKGARGNRPAPHRLQRGQSRRISGSTAPGASATSPSRGASGPTCLFRTGANIQFSGSSACTTRCRNRCSWLLPAQFAITGTLRWRLSMVLCSYRRCALFAETWVFLLDFITLLSRFRHLICSALRKVTVKNFFNE